MEIQPVGVAARWGGGPNRNHAARCNDGTGRSRDAQAGRGHQDDAPPASLPCRP